MKHRFELDGAITRDQINDVRKFVERIHRKLLAEGELVSRIAMAAHELFENAVKFSTDGSAKLCVDISRESSPLRVCITTTNRATDEDIDELREMRDALGAATDMETFYLELMKRTDPSVRGGLGLGRVAAETHMTLRMDLQDDLVTIRAELVESAV